MSQCVVAQPSNGRDNIFLGALPNRAPSDTSQLWEKTLTKDSIKSLNLSKVPSFIRDIEWLSLLRHFRSLLNYETTFKGY